MEQDISYARLQTIEKKREQLIKIIWTLTLYGDFVNNDLLEIDSKTFMSQKIHGMYNILTDYLNDLKLYDIHCEIIPLVDNGWLTPMGGLRKEGWKFTLKFGETLFGADTLRTLKNIVTKLNDKFGKRAFNKFNKAELNI